MEPVDPARCPLCGNTNACALAGGVACGTAPSDRGSCSDCWCTRVVIPADVLARVPAAAQGRACICAACARAAPAREPVRDAGQEVGRVRD